MRRHSLQRIQRLLLLICFIALLGVGLIAARIFGFGGPGLIGAVLGKRVALISGHAGYDSGAVCQDADGNVTVTEAEINANIASLVAERLRRAGAEVLILQEFDDQLTNLQADVLLSLHADSCIDATGYKAASAQNSPIQTAEDRLIACVDHNYPAATGLTLHKFTITHDMTDYHAFRVIQPQTPAAILELGFLGGDQKLLTQQPERAATGVAESILCFLVATNPTLTLP